MSHEEIFMSTKFCLFTNDPKDIDFPLTISGAHRMTQKISVLSLCEHLNCRDVRVVFFSIFYFKMHFKISSIYAPGCQNALSFNKKTLCPLVVSYLNVR
jgi:hypothetical protein